MHEIKAGVVVVNRFCSPGSKMFFSYIDYMDREEAIRNEAIEEYNLFNDYMGNPKKTTGLFTDGKRKLSKDEISELTERFCTAQENQSLMWQTVISFDNRWLEEYGLYDSKTHILNEDKIKEMANIAINKMLRNERLENAIWTAAFHYNTDNIHIHVATVEEVPQREKRMYQQYSYVTNDKNRLVKDKKIVDLKGNPVYEEEIKGKFKAKSFELCKQYIVNEITRDKSLNQDINKLIRERMVRSVNTNEILRDPELAQMVLELKEKLPDVSGNLLNYNNPIMASMKEELNRISEYYLQKYHGEEYVALMQMINKQSEMYRKAYGESTKERDYLKTKTQDLYTRMGNSILKSIKSFDENTNQGAETYLFVQEEQEEVHEVVTGENYIVPNMSNESLFSPTELEDYYLKWENDFKKAKYDISEYSKGKEEISIDKAYEALHKLERMDRRGSVLAKYELGGIYKYGKIDLQDDEAAYEYYKDALKGYEYIYSNLGEYLSGEGKEPTEKTVTFYEDYTSYRIGRMYNKGLGTEVNYEKAREYFEISNSTYAKYALGELYFEGTGVEQSYEKAALNYEKAVSDKKGNPYAFYRLGQMHHRGWHYEPNQEQAKDYFEKALQGFNSWDKGDDMFLKYRIGFMHYYGYGTEKNLEKALEYFEDSLKLGNENAKYMVGRIYADPESKVFNLKKGLDYLEEAAQEGNVFAMCDAGMIYMGEEHEYYNPEKGITLLEQAAEQESSKAQYLLGKIYTHSESELYHLSKGIMYYEQAAAQGHGMAIYRLGCLYMDPELPVCDREKGVRYLVEAAEQQIVPAQYQLGKIYTDPNLGCYDLRKGIKYYEQAATHGHEQAMYRVGLIYTEQKSEVYDLKKGIEYLEKAASQGNQFAMCRLGTIYANPESEVYDFQKGIDYLKEAMNMGSDYAACKLGDIYYYQQHDTISSIEFYKRASDNGNIYAKNQILRIAAGAQGNHVRKNFEFERALRELKKSFEKDYRAWKNIMEYDAILDRRLREENQEL